MWNFSCGTRNFMALVLVGAYQEHYRISRELTGLFSLLLLRHMGSQASAVRKAVFDVDAKKLLSWWVLHGSEAAS